MRKPFAEFVKNELGTGFLLIVCGLPGTWKTETTAEVAKIKGYPLLRTDLIRLEVMKSEDIWNEKEASRMDKRTLVYDEMFSRAEKILEKKGGVILDATFVTQSLRRRAAAIAAKHNFTFIIMQTDCPQEMAVARILRRTKENYESNAITEEAYLSNKTKFEPVDLNDIKTAYPELNIIHFVVDTSEDPPQDWYVISVNNK
ncbi:MAG TPA: ATP-binding protein [Dehalococcoidia bacterium]